MKIKFQGQDCIVKFTRYMVNNRVAIELEDTSGEPYCIASVNIPKAQLEDDEVCIKDYSENEGVLDALVEAGILKKTGKYVSSGYVNIPICKILRSN